MKNSEIHCFVCLIHVNVKQSLYVLAFISTRPLLYVSVLRMCSLSRLILQVINIRAPLNVHLPAYLYDGLHM